MTTFSLAAEAVQFLNVCQIANPEGGGLTDFGSSSYHVGSLHEASDSASNEIRLVHFDWVRLINDPIFSLS